MGSSAQHRSASEGIRQFIDIGTGLPAANNTHEVSQAAAPESRVVYVDNDPLVLAHARALLTSSPDGVTAYLDADLQDTDTILQQAATTLDFSRPVGIVLLAILHYVPDLAEAHGIVSRLMGAVPAGSFLVISHAGSDLLPANVAEFEKSLNAHLPAEHRHVARPRDVVAAPPPSCEAASPGSPRRKPQAHCGGRAGHERDRRGRNFCRLVEADVQDEVSEVQVKCCAAGPVHDERQEDDGQDDDHQPEEEHDDTGDGVPGHRSRSSSHGLQLPGAVLLIP
jgi:hypothetical protein